MNRENLNISNIETFLYGLISGEVSENTYVGTLPDTTKSAWNDMVLIDMGTGISDLTAMGRGVINVFLYSKPRADGSKNVNVMSGLEQRLDEVVRSTRDENYCINVSYRDTGFDNARKWHYTIVALNLMIF